MLKKEVYNQSCKCLVKNNLVSHLLIERARRPIYFEILNHRKLGDICILGLFEMTFLRVNL